MTNGSFQHGDHVSIQKKVVDVAVVVLRYQEEFLLAKRHLHQHQGGKLEFVGGKIETAESLRAASMREVEEEIGLLLSDEQIGFLGVIEHHYPDKQVRLQVSQAHLNPAQYEQMRKQSYGREQQQLFWLTRTALLASADALPAANVRILDWLSIEPVVLISHDVSAFADEKAFVDFYAQHLSQGARFYLRVQSLEMAAKIFDALTTLRADIRWILPYRLWQQLNQVQQAKVWAIKLQGADVEALANADSLPSDIGDEYFYLVSVHDDAQAHTVNRLAERMAILAAFVSPVCATKTHPEVQPIGWQAFSALNDKLTMPAIALGGLSIDDWHTAQQHGAIAVSGIRGF